jgi:hypothetical protein
VLVTYIYIYIYIYISWCHALVGRIGSGLELDLRKIFFLKLRRAS